MKSLSGAVTSSLPPDVTRDEHKQRWKEEIPVLEAELEDCKPEDFDRRAVIQIMPRYDMQLTLCQSDHEQVKYLERYYIGAHIFGHVWGLNAQGIYYHHYYIPVWITADHKLWVPSLQDTNWDDAGEEDRRVRARKIVRHIRQNEKWAKSEYAWEADAWKDVFGMMRDDPFIKRSPDATFGLATFKPRDYQSPIAEWDLDRDRLEALSLDRYCGLHSDPSWGRSSLVFPFAAYEAKGWSGDPREAQRQACSAGSVYLDMLGRLTKVPEKPGELDGAYQAEDSRNSQVFVFTSFGLPKDLEWTRIN
ncbi:hypothetical protein IL306_006518 [Fusarium sp. DS 682]|nr:hypothetical protein IL306_006518 [Fusarium sp. DS 682]